MTKQLTWVEAIRRVLNDAGGPMHYSAISEAILEQGLRELTGATPSQTVAAQLSVRTSGDNPEFVRISQGIYDLTKSRRPVLTNSTSSIGYSENEETGALRALGIVWRRENITWRQNGVLLGRQYTQSEPVDFSAQIGVYLLHDRDRVNYVGRAGESLYTRLLAHTTDRMEGRWDRFLWFGLKAVNNDASLSSTTPKMDPPCRHRNLGSGSY